MANTGAEFKTKESPVVGIPRALMTFDMAPFFTGFLNQLQMEAVLSPPTNKRIIQKALKYGYPDSCLPVKLLYGHVAALLDLGVPYIMIPNAIRMSKKGGEEDQRYSCPLVQAAPYLIRSAFNLGDRVLDPVIDLSHGDTLVLNSFARIAQRFGFSRREGLMAAREGLKKQRLFEADLRESGKKLLAELEADHSKIGVVFLSRAYNSQDDGANLGMAVALKKLGVAPIPLDFLPLQQVDISRISDRPYWNYERKLLAAAQLIAEHRQLFGLFLSNFGCGPNSFIQNLVEDIMGGKPMGQIEIDEHAAEAGIITRLEAFVDTIRGYHRAGLHLPGDPEQYRRYVPGLIREAGAPVFIPPMAAHAFAVAAAMRAYGIQAWVLPESDERSLALSRDITNGKECLPFSDTLGVFLRTAEDGGFPPRSRILMASSFGPCRFGKYALEQQRVLNERDIDVKIKTTVSNNGGYDDLGLGVRFELLAWKGMVSSDRLLDILRKVRPYEKKEGGAEDVYNHYLHQLEGFIESRRPFDKLMREAAQELMALRDPSKPKKPLVGINGEIYLRANRFCNNNLEKQCEANGLEITVSPMSEWIAYTTWRGLEDAWGNKDFRKLLKGGLRKLLLDHYQKKVSSWFDRAVSEHEPSTRELLKASGSILPSRNGSEAVLSIGSGIRQMENPNYAGVISVMPHGCMPGGIVAAIAEQISRQFSHKPWISLTYDGFADKVNPEKLADFAEQLRHGANG